MEQWDSGTVGQWDNGTVGQTWVEDFECVTAEGLCLAPLETEPVLIQCAAAWGFLSDLLSLRAHGPFELNNPKIKAGKECPKRPSQHALGKGNNIMAWKAGKSITVCLEVLPRAVSDAIRSSRDFWASLRLTSNKLSYLTHLRSGR